MPAPATTPASGFAPTPVQRVIAWLQRALALALAWALVAEGDLSGGWFAAAWIVALASIHCSIDGWRPWRFRARALAHFTAFFVVQSVRGGVDVAWRALSPRLPIAPRLLRLALRISPGPARTFLTIVVSLLPGTLAVAIDGDELLLHVIDERLPVETAVRQLEAHAIELFGRAHSEPGGAV